MFNKKWILRILAALPSIFIAIHGDQFSILPQSFVEWKKTHTIESLIGIGLLWWACTMTVLWIQRGWGLNTLKQVKQKAEQMLNDLRNADIPDLPFGEAVDLVKKYAPRHITNYQIQEKIVEMAHLGKIKVWGEPILMLSMTSGSGNKVEIPKEFFFSANWAPTEDGGYYFEILSSQPGWDDWRNHEKYDNVTLNRAQAEALFSSKIP